MPVNRNLGSLSVSVVADAKQFVETIKLIEGQVRSFNDLIASFRANLASAGKALSASNVGKQGIAAPTQIQAIDALTRSVGSLVKALKSQQTEAKKAAQANAEATKETERLTAAQEAFAKRSAAAQRGAQTRRNRGTINEQLTGNLAGFSKGDLFRNLFAGAGQASSALVSRLPGRSFISELVGVNDIKTLKEASEGIGRVKEAFSGGFVRPFVEDIKSALGILLRFQAAGAIINTLVGSFNGLRTAAASFEDEMKQVQAITGATSSEMLILSDAARKVGKETIVGAGEAAKGLQILGQAGFTAAESAKALESIVALSVGSGASLAESAQITTTVLRAFDIDVNRSAEVVNILLSTVNKTKSSVEDLNVAFNFAGTTAANAGLSVSELGAVVGVLADNGVRASTQGTAVRQAISSLIKPTDDAKRIFKELGINLADINPLTNDFVKILKTLRDAGFGTAESFQAFDKRAASAIALLINNAGAVSDLQQKITGTTAAFDALATRQESTNAAFQIFLNNLNDLAISLGEGFLPVAKSVLDVLTSIIKVLNQPIVVGGLIGLVAAGTFTLLGAQILGVVTKIKQLAEVARTIGYIQELTAAALTLKGRLVATTIAEIEAASATSLLTASLSPVRIAFLSLFSVIEAHPIIAAFTATITALGVAWKYYSDLQEEATKKIRQGFDDFQNLNKYVSDLREQVVSATKAIESTQVGTVKYYENLKKVQEAAQDLVKIYPDLIKYIDQSTHAFTLSGDELDKVIRKKEYNSIVDQLRAAEEEFKRYTEAAYPLGDTARILIANEKGFDKTSSGILEKINALRVLATSTKQAASALGDATQELRDAVTAGDFEKESKTISDELSKVKDTLIGNVKKFFKDDLSTIVGSDEIFVSLRKKLDEIFKLDKNVNAENFSKLLQEIIPSLNDEEKKKYADFLNNNSALFESFQRLIDVRKQSSAAFSATNQDLSKQLEVDTKKTEEIQKRIAGLRAERDAITKGTTREAQEAAQAWAVFDEASQKALDKYDEFIKSHSTKHGDITPVLSKQALNVLDEGLKLAEAERDETLLKTSNTQLRQDTDAQNRLTKQRIELNAERVYQELAGEGKIKDAIEAKYALLESIIDLEAKFKNASVVQAEREALAARKINELRKAGIAYILEEVAADKKKYDVSIAANEREQKQIQRTLATRLRLIDAGVGGGGSFTKFSLTKDALQKNIEIEQGSQTLRQQQYVDLLKRQAELQASISVADRKELEVIPAKVDAAFKEIDAGNERLQQLKEELVLNRANLGVTIDLGSSIKSAFSGVFDSLFDKKKKIGDVFKDLGKSLTKELLNGLADVLIKKLDFDKKFTLNMEGLADGTKKSFGDAFGEIFKSAGDGFSKLFGGASDGAKKVAGDLADPLKGAGNTAGDLPSPLLGGQEPKTAQDFAIGPDQQGPLTESQSAALSDTASNTADLASTASSTAASSASSFAAIVGALYSIYGTIQGAVKLAKNNTKVTKGDKNASANLSALQGVNIAAFTAAGVAVGATAGAAAFGIGAIPGAIIGGAIGAALGQALNQALTKTVGTAINDGLKKSTTQSELRNKVLTAPKIVAITGGGSALAAGPQSGTGLGSSFDLRLSHAADSPQASLYLFMKMFNVAIGNFLPILLEGLLTGLVPDIERIYDQRLSQQIRDHTDTPYNRQLKNERGDLGPGGNAQFTRLFGKGGEGILKAKGDQAAELAGLFTGAGNDNPQRLRRFFLELVNNAIKQGGGSDAGVEKALNDYIRAFTGGSFIRALQQSQKLLGFNKGTPSFHSLKFNDLLIGAYQAVLPGVDLKALADLVQSSRISRVAARATKQGGKVVKDASSAFSNPDVTSAIDDFSKSIAASVNSAVVGALRKAFLSPVDQVVGQFFQVINTKIKKAIKNGGITEEAFAGIISAFQASGENLAAFFDIYSSEFKRLSDISKAVTQAIEDAVLTDDQKIEKKQGIINQILDNINSTITTLSALSYSIKQVQADLANKIFRAQNPLSEQQTAPGSTNLLAQGLSDQFNVVKTGTPGASFGNLEGQATLLTDFMNNVDSFLESATSAVKEQYTKSIELAKQAKQALLGVRDTILGIKASRQSATAQEKLSVIAREIKKQREIMQGGTPEEQLDAAGKLENLYTQNLAIAKEQLDQSGPLFQSLERATLVGLEEVQSFLGAKADTQATLEEQMAADIKVYGDQAILYYKYIQDTLPPILEARAAEYKDKLDAITNALVGATGGVNLYDAIKGLGSLSATQLGEVATTIGNIVNKPVTVNVTPDPTPVVDTPGDAGEGLSRKINSIFGATPGLPKEKVVEVLKTALDKFAQMFTGPQLEKALILRDTLKYTLGSFNLPKYLNSTATANLIDYFRNLIASSRYKFISEKTPDFMDLVTKNLRKAIPKAAKGLMTMGRTLAEIGEAGPEAVVPLNSSGISRFMNIISKAVIGSQYKTMSMAAGLHQGVASQTTTLNVQSGAFQIQINGGDKDAVENLPKELMDELVYEVRYGRLGKVIQEKVK